MNRQPLVEAFRASAKSRPEIDQHERMEQERMEYALENEIRHLAYPASPGELEPGRFALRGRYPALRDPDKDTVELGGEVLRARANDEAVEAGERGEVATGADAEAVFAKFRRS